MCVYHDNSESKVRRRSGVPSNAIRGEGTSTRERYPLSRPFLVRSSSPSRARDRAQDEAWNRGEWDTFFRVSLSHLAARVHDYDAPVPCIKSLSLSREGAPWTRTRGRLARTTLLFSCADRARRWARARRSARSRPVRR